MIVPSSRLLFWTALALIPLATLAGAFPGAAIPLTLVLAVLVGAVVVDAVDSRRRLRGLRVFLADVVRLTKGRPGGIEVRFENPGLRAIRLRLGLPFPPEISSSQAEAFLSLPAETLTSRIVLECVPLQRG